MDADDYFKTIGSRLMTMLQKKIHLLMVWMTVVPMSLAADYQKSFLEGLEAEKIKNWALMATKMKEAVAERPAEGGKVLSGNIPYDYLPHYYLGLANFRSGNYDAALEAFAESERQGKVRAARSLYASMTEMQRIAETRASDFKMSPQKPATPGPTPASEDPVQMSPQKPATPRPAPASEDPVQMSPQQPVMRRPAATPTRAPPVAQKTMTASRPATRRFRADQVLTNSASIAFNAPEEIALRERRVIQLLLDPRQTIPELLAGEITEPGRVESATIRISEEIEATLSGDAFDIRAITPERQALSAESNTEWRWEVQPKEPGTHRLFLTINGILEASGQTRTIRTFNREIRVLVPPAPARSAAQTETDPTRQPRSVPWIGLAVVLALLALATFAFRQRGRTSGATDVSRDPTVKLDDVAGGPLRPGQVVADRYGIDRVLGRGGMGMVYAARDREFGGELIALKTILPHLAAGERNLERFKREIQYARRVAHPNVCRIFDVGRDGAITFVTMEYIEGISLSEQIHSDGPYREEAALPIIEQIAAGLDETHRAGIIHRDLKTGNIMLADNGRRAVLMDFGLACLAPGHAVESLTQTGAVVGSPMYMAPEQFERGVISEATDIYAFGTVIYELLTAALPFEGDTPVSIIARRLREAPIPPSQRVPSISLVSEGVILRCLARNPAERYQRAGDVFRALAGRGERGESPQ